jgi:hypothetical protein
MLERPHRGTLFGASLAEPGGGYIRYMAHLTDLNLTCSIRVPAERPKAVDGTAGMFRLFLFESEHSVHRKVRAQWI